MRRRTRALAIACAMSLVVAACGDDDDVASGGDGEQAAGDLDAYCDLIEELDSQDGPPTAEQMERVKEIRPDEIGEEIDMVADAFIEADGDIGAVFADPAIEEAFEVIDAHDADACGFEPVDEGAGEVNPEFAEYCAASAAMDEADGPPTTETIEELVSLMSDDIVDQGQIVLDAFEANDGDVGAVFSDPAVGEAIGAIEAWEAENCGIGDGEDEDDGDLEAADGAEVIPVTGVDFEFRGVPESVSAGPLAFEFTNDGDAIHEAVLFALDGKTVDDVIADATEAFEADEDDLGDLGFAFSPPGGDARYINADLEAGEYVLICFIPGPEGKAHHELGMQQTFTVG